MHVDGLNETLFSVGQICDTDSIVVFIKTEAVIINQSQFSVDEKFIDAVARRNLISRLYEINNPSSFKANYVKIPSDINVWHQRLIHTNVKVLQSLCEHTADVPRLKGKLQSCPSCVMGKAKRKAFDSHFEPAEYAGEIVHSHSCGKLPASIHGNRYFCTFVDQYSRFTHVATIKEKGDASNVSKYKKLAQVEKYFKNGIKRLHTDGGGEYKLVDVYLHTETTPDTPQHNPFAERINRTLVETVRVMLEQAGLSAKYWEYAIEHAAYVKNRLPHSALSCSLYEKLCGKKPPLKNLRPYGCAAYVYNEKPKSKFHSRAQPETFLGCDDHGRYTVELIQNKKVVNSVQVTFEEDSFPALENPDSSSTGEEPNDWSGGDDNSNNSDSDKSLGADTSDSEDDIFQQNHNLNSTETGLGNSQSASQQHAIEPSNSKSRSNQQTQTSPKRSARPTKRPDYSSGKYTKYRARLVKIPITTSDEPTVEEALNATGPEQKLWKKAIRKELRTFRFKKTWSRVLNNHKTTDKLSSHIVLKIKRDEKGRVKKFKARLVAGGHRQVFQRDYDTVYAPVVSFILCILTLILAFSFGWLCKHVDVTAAFLNGDIDRELFIEFPYNIPNCSLTGTIYKLHKALYGLKQALLLWYRKLQYELMYKLN